MSSHRHAVVLGPSFTGFGKRPSATPAHHDELEMGSSGSNPGEDFWSPIICFSRKYRDVVASGFMSFS